MAVGHEERPRSVVRLVGERQRRSGQCLAKQHGACVEQRRRQLCRHGQVEEHARTATATGGVEERRTGADAAEAWHQAWGGHDEREHLLRHDELRRGIAPPTARAPNVDSHWVCQISHEGPSAFICPLAATRAFGDQPPPELLPLYKLSSVRSVRVALSSIAHQESLRPAVFFG